MKINVFASGGKGGVGKTLVATSVAYAASEMTDKKVIMVCGDPHTGSAEVLLQPGNMPSIGWVEYLNNPLYDFRDVVAPSKLRENILVIPSKRGRVFYAGGIPDVIALNLETLKQAWERDPEVALVVIDSMAGKPHDVLVYALAFDLYLIANPTELDLVSILEFIRDVEAEKRERGWMVTCVNGVVANRVGKWSLRRLIAERLGVGDELRDVRRIEERLGMRCIAEIPESRAVVEAEERHLPVTLYKPGDRASIAMRRIASMLLEKAEKTTTTTKAAEAEVARSWASST